MTGAALLLAAMLAMTTDRLHDAVEEGNRAMVAKDYEQALAAYGKAATIAPDSAAVNLDLAAALYASGHPEEALALYRRLGADETQPHGVQAKLNGSAAAILAGDLHRQQGDEESAQQLYREGLEMATSYSGYRPDDDRGAKNIELAKKRMEEPPPTPPEQDQQQGQDEQDQDQKKEDQSESSQGDGDQQKEDAADAPPPDQGEKQQDQQKPEQGEGEKPSEPDSDRSEQKESPGAKVDPGDLTEQQAASILRAVETDEQELREQIRRERAEKYDTPPPGGKDW